MPPRRRQVEVLDLAGRRQDIVGVPRGVCDEQVMHHGEQVFAGEALFDQRLIGDRHRRVRAIDHQRLDWRIECWIAEVLAQIAHVERTRRLPPVRAFDRLHVERGVM